MNRVLLKYNNLAYAAILFFALSPVFVSSAGARELHIEKFDSEIVVSPNGSIVVTETIQAQFIGSWKGLYREIPVEYFTPQGLNYTLFLNVKRVTDENGNSLKFESSRERHYRKLKIYVPGAQDASWMQSLAAEMNLSETAYFIGSKMASACGGSRRQWRWTCVGMPRLLPLTSFSTNSVMLITPCDSRPVAGC